LVGRHRADGDPRPALRPPAVPALADPQRRGDRRRRRHGRAAVRRRADARPPPGAALRLRPAVRAGGPRRLTRPGRERRGARGNGCVTIARSLPHPGIAGGEGPLHPVSQVSERTTGVDIDVHGTVAEGFERVGEAFARNFTALGERGAALAVYRDGRRVVDLWAGTKAVGGTDPWPRSTAQAGRPA